MAILYCGTLQPLGVVSVNGVLQKKEASNISLNNFYSLLIQSKDLPEVQKLARDVREIRNFTAHPSEADVASADFSIYFEWLQRFAVFIGTTIDDAVELLYKENEKDDREKRNKLFDLLNTKVIAPALDCPGLIQDIKESVRDTLKRLEKTNTAKDIYNWFYDALDSRRGGQVYDALRDNNLTAFEDITGEFFDIYWRN